MLVLGASPHFQVGQVRLFQPQALHSAVLGLVDPKDSCVCAGCRKWPCNGNIYGQH